MSVVDGISDSDFLARRKTVVATAMGVCQVVNDRIFEKYGLHEGVRFVGDGKVVEQYTKDYFSVIKQFKNNHKFQKEKIANEAKRAAAWVVAVGTGNSIANMFIFHPDVEKSVYKEMIEGYFLYNISCAYMYIQTNIIDPKFENELLHNLVKNRTPLVGPKRVQHIDWLVTQMHAIMQLGKTLPP